MVAGGRLGVVVVVVVDSKCDDGGENRSAEGNKVLKYVLVHGRQWAGMGNGCLGSAVLRYILKLQKMANIDRRMTSRVNFVGQAGCLPANASQFFAQAKIFCRSLSL